MEEEHEAYGGDIPEYEEEGDMGMHTGEMLKRLHAAGFREIQYEEEEDMGMDPGQMLKRLHETAFREMSIPVVRDHATSEDQASTEEADSRSIFVGNVDCSCTPEEVQQHFQSCGTVNRVTISTDEFGQPKGYAYVEFLDEEAVQNALHLNQSELRNRQLKVSPKRTNVRHYRYRGRRFDPYLTYYPSRPRYARPSSFD